MPDQVPKSNINLRKKVYTAIMRKKRELAIFLLVAFTLILITTIWYVTSDTFRAPTAEPGTEPPVNVRNGAEDLVTLIGVVQSSGLRDEELRSLNLQGVRYQLAEVNANDYNVSGAFLVNGNLSQLVGKCVRVQGDFVEGWEGVNMDSSSISGVFAYGRTALNVISTERLNYDNCTIYEEVEPFDMQFHQRRQFIGTVDRVERPAPDIGYDYVINLNEPFEDPLDAAGPGIARDTLVIMPGSNSIWRTIEESMGAQVLLEGFMTWGYAETRHFVIESLTLASE
jgi:hypothetical protein